MADHQLQVFPERRYLHSIRRVFAAIAVAMAGVLSPAIGDAAGQHKSPARERFREVVPWLPEEFLPAGELIALEEHAQFVYLAGRPAVSQEPSGGDNRVEFRTRLVFLRPATLIVDAWHVEAKQPDIGTPTARSTVEVPLASGKKSRRTVCVYRHPEQETARKTDSLRIQDNVCDVASTDSGRTFHLELPLELRQTARIAITSTDGQRTLPKRHLPAGVMPYGPKGMRLIESWDSRYRGDSRPGWDKGFVSSHLEAAVAGGVIKPGRAVVLGCGTGTNAIYLAKQGFDVTAIDIAPTALNLAEGKAEKAGVRVRWLLADVLAPPADLGTFDFIFDRGCYHGVRRHNALGYVKTVKRLSRPGTQILILAGNANEARHYGPPRVKEEELRGDFASAFDFVRLDMIRFDSIDPKKQGALAWSVLLRRKAKESP